MQLGRVQFELIQLLRVPQRHVRLAGVARDDVHALLAQEDDGVVILDDAGDGRQRGAAHVVRELARVQVLERLHLARPRLATVDAAVQRVQTDVARHIPSSYWPGRENVRRQYTRNMVLASLVAHTMSSM